MVLAPLRSVGEHGLLPRFRLWKNGADINKHNERENLLSRNGGCASAPAHRLNWFCRWYCNPWAWSDSCRAPNWASRPAAPALSSKMVTLSKDTLPRLHHTRRRLSSGSSAPSEARWRPSPTDISKIVCCRPNGSPAADWTQKFVRNPFSNIIQSVQSILKNDHWKEDLVKIFL